MAFSLPDFDVRFVGAILVKARPKRNISATIVAEVKRFSHQINTDEVFGTHNAPIYRAIQHVGCIVSAPVLGGLHHHYCRI
jgi:hypothetical protein